MKSVVIALFLAFTSLAVFAAPKNGGGGGSATSADVLGAKAFLEDLMARRFSQGLSTIVENSAYSVGVQLDLTDVPKRKDAEKKDVTIETPVDLMVGTLDPEKLIQQYNLADEKPPIVALLATKRIKSIMVSVGLREDVGDAIKADVEKWIQTRVDNEFKGIGKSEVTFVKKVPEKTKDEKKKDWSDWLTQFQALAAAALLAATLILGILLWRFTTAKANVSSTKNGDPASIKLQAEGLGGGAGSASDAAQKISAMQAEENRKASEDLLTLTRKINTLIARVTNEMEAVVRAWCQAGDEGIFKLTCFAEAVGQDIGKLPIPVDAAKKVAQSFAKMAKTPAMEKLQALEKAYWDNVSVINLGSDVLSQPFAYLSSVEPAMINEVLMTQNPKMRTLVSVFLPEDVRRSFLKPMTAEQKGELLEQAAQMNVIASEELKSFDASMAKRFKKGDSADLVQLDSTLARVVESLTPVEEVLLLGAVKNVGVLEYKRKNASLAFFHEWPDDKMSIALERARTDQLTVYLRLKEDMQTKMIGLCPPMTAEVLADELRMPDRFSAEEKNEKLIELKAILSNMVTQREIDLSEVFASQAPAENNVVSINTA